MKYIKKVMYNKRLIIELLFILLSIICVILSIKKYYLYELNENQILYMFSTGAQVISSLFGITLAGYVFFNDRLDKEVQDDETLFEIVDSLKAKYYKMIKRMGLVLILSIILTLINMTLVSNSANEIIHIYLLNQTILLFLLEVVYVVIFIVSVTDPNKFIKANELLKKQMDKENDNEGNLAEFLKYYNMLEGLIIKTANGIVNSNNNNYHHKQYKPQIFQSLKVLLSKEIINNKISEKINELRIYRNYVVHNSEPSVSQKACNELIELYDTVQKLIDDFEDHK